MEEIINNTEENITQKKRLVSLDFLKFFCAFFVVCLHIPFPGLSGNLFNSAICRIAIPIFFMITGFFYTNTKNNNREVKQIVKIIWYIVLATLVSFSVRIAVSLYKGTIDDYFKSFLSFKTWINLLAFNESPFGTHIWYLNAILYVLLIVLLFEKIIDRKFLYPLIPILLVGCLILGSYSKTLFGVENNIYIYRNFAFIGLPFFLIGDLFFRIKDKIIEVFSGSKTIIVLFVSILLIVGSFFEAYYLRYYYSYDLYILNIFSSVSVFVFFILINNCLLNNKFVLFVSSLGRKYSQLIYIFQIAFISLSGFVSLKLGEAIWYSIAAPFLVFGFSLLISFLAKTLISFAFKKEI